MAKEFTIYLNKRLTECDILVYSIPYRDGLTAIHRLLLGSCMKGYILQKLIAAQTNSELVHQMGEMLKNCYERLDDRTEIAVSAALELYYALYPGTADVVVSADCINTLPQLFTSIESAMQLTAQPIMAYIGKSGGSAESDAIVNAALQKDVKSSMLAIAPSLACNASVSGTAKKAILSAQADIPIAGGLTDLCYRCYTGAQIALQMAADVLAAELRNSFGKGTSALALTAGMGNGDYTTKYEGVTAIVSIWSAATEEIQQFMEPAEHGLTLGFAADPILKRHRLLHEMDSGSLSAYDDMTLEDTDYVIL